VLKVVFYHSKLKITFFAENVKIQGVLASHSDAHGEGFYCKGVNRTISTTWQWLYWIKLFKAITVELKDVVITAEH